MATTASVVRSSSSTTIAAPTKPVAPVTRWVGTEGSSPWAIEVMEPADRGCDGRSARLRALGYPGGPVTADLPPGPPHSAVRQAVAFGRDPYGFLRRWHREL